MSEQFSRLQAAQMLSVIAGDCSRMEDSAFWILSSAAAHLNGYDLNDGQPSSVERWWKR